LSDLPHYTIRESTRAKHVILRASLHDGLVVVVPKGFDRRQVSRILTGKREWIERANARIERKRAILAADADGDLPERMSLNAVDEEWQIDYERSAPSSVTLAVHSDGRLLITGDIDNPSLVRTALRRFLMARARGRLDSWLESLAEEHGFSANGISVRLQRTRWGSCSPRGTISLNAKLLFLPRDLVEYVLIHELCHTIHHNHSRDFWLLMQEHLSQAQTLRKRLREEAWRYVPLWSDTIYHRETG
jgi:predicted metal-dependent hydrolase